MKASKEQKAYMRNYYHDNKDKYKIYAERRKDKIIEYRKKHYQENKEKINARTKKYYQENKEKVKKQVKEYAQEHKEQVLEYKKRYKQKNKKLWIPILEEIFGEIKCCKCDYDRCFAALHFHHKNPKTKKYEMGDLLPKKPTPEKIEEFKKCKILCSNCHIEHHQMK